MATNIVVTKPEMCEGIEAAVMSVEGVTNCEILFNNEMTVCPYTSIPPFSIKIIVSGKFKKKEVAKAIWNTKPLGILLFGSTNKKIKDSMGYKHIIKFEIK